MTPAIDQNPERLVLRNELAELSQLSRWIEACTRQELSSNLAFAVALCLEEAVVNIIMHSGGDDCPTEITVEIAREPGGVTARIEDNGREFDPTRVPPPPMASSLKEAKVGNLGVHLMRSFASELRYQRSGERNQLTLRFLDPEAKSAGAKP